MEEKEYSVSEAVRLVGVESHVLRYWEEELRLEIRRNAQGHRVYSGEDIATFRDVRQLKEKGLQLKAIRLLLDSRAGTGSQADGEKERFASRLRVFEGEEGMWTGCAPGGTLHGVSADETGAGEDNGEELCCEVVPADAREDEVHLFERILRRLIGEVVSEQNEKLEEAIAGRVRGELEDFYLQYCQIVREAAASLEPERKPGRLRQALNKLLFRR